MEDQKPGVDQALQELQRVEFEESKSGDDEDFQMEEPNNEAKCEESEKRGNGDDLHDFVPTLKSYLDMLGLRIVHVPGNGACFYYAMYGTKLLHLEGNSISMSKVHNDGATAMKRAILDCLLDNLDRMIANGDAHADILYRRYFGRTYQGPIADAIHDIKVFIKDIQLPGVERGLRYSQWAADHEIMAAVLLLREPVFVFDVGIQDQGSRGTVDAVFVSMYRLELRDENDLTSECVKCRSLQSHEAHSILATFQLHRVVPVMVTIDHRASHYECLRAKNELQYQSWYPANSLGGDSHVRIGDALRELGIYAPPRLPVGGVVQQSTLAVQDVGRTQDSKELSDFTKRQSLKPCGPTAKKRQRVSTSEAIEVKYATPENEDPVAAKRRKNNKRAAVSRAKKKQNVSTQDDNPENCRRRLEDAMRENEVTNATPTVPEPPLTRTCRQARRRKARSRLNSLMRALAVDDIVDAAASGVIVGSASYVANSEDATIQKGESVVPTSSGTVDMGTSQPSDSLRERRRQERNEYARLWRAGRTKSQKERDKESRRNRRLELMEGQVLRDREQRPPLRNDNVLEQIDDRLSRYNHSEPVAQSSALMDEPEQDRDEPRAKRRTRRYKDALANHEDFTISKISGKDVNKKGRHQLPEPKTICGYCSAWKWPRESPIMCCLEGKVALPPLQTAPSVLRKLYRDEDFRKNIRSYNQVFAFTSIGASVSSSGFERVAEDRSVQGQRGVYTYRIQGAMGHFLGSLLPGEDAKTGEAAAPQFAQIYVYDADAERRVARRQGIFQGLNGVALMDLEHMLTDSNPFAKEFIGMGERIRQMRRAGEKPIDVAFSLHANNAAGAGTHNLPTSTEVAAILVEDGKAAQPRDLLLFQRSGGILRLWETHNFYDPTQYPLLLPFGELGWTYTDPYSNGATYRKKQQMALREHVAFRLYQKINDQSVLHQGGRLFQQYVVDQRAKIEQETLRWIDGNQPTCRAEVYKGVEDAYLNENVVRLREGDALLSEYDRDTEALVHPNRNASRHFLDKVGQRVILPASFTGGDRYMYAQYQDAMAMVREFGKPDLFMTVTCNPQWKEIKEVVERNGPHQTAQDRPDIVARVWHQKLNAVLKDLDDGVFGGQIARIYVVEFQKRGLPHAHILIILEDGDKPKTREQFDKFVSAEVPDASKNKALFKTVMGNMMHGPCGALNPKCACMKDGKCSKDFPKPLSEVTQTNQNGYPVYKRRRRPEGELEFNGRVYDNATVNQWVVPYNPYFSQKYNCHINVEVCSTITAVKYLYKYVYKGADKTEITLQAVRDDTNASERPRREPNELIRHIKARYISPVEACQRLFEYPIQGKTHTIVKLDIHTPGNQFITYRSTDDPEDVLERQQHTKLTRFFELAGDDEQARSMLYQNIPKVFRWDAKERRWFRYKKKQRTIGRMVHCSPRDPERFYLRLLLCHRRGPTSFTDLRTINNVEYATFKDAATAAGLIENDDEWIACMTEGSLFHMPYQFRQLFATILIYGIPGNVKALWEKFYAELSRDYEYKYRSMSNKDDMVKFKTLLSFNELLTAGGMSLTAFPDLPQLCEFPKLVIASLLDNHLIRRELEGYDRNELRRIVDDVGRLNESQRGIYNEIISAIEDTQPVHKLFFIDGPGGTGKSTLLNHILARIRGQGMIAIAVASSGIASLLLPGGRTAHSTFKIPIKLSQSSTCHIPKQSKLAVLINQASLIVWDEAPMTHRHAFEAVDRTLRDVLDNGCEPFGGKVVVLSGDFRQILPVVKNGTPLDTVEASLRSSYLWSQFKKVHLTVNMRVLGAANPETAAELADFAQMLLQIGEGRHEVDEDLGPDFMKIPSDLLIDNPDYDPHVDGKEDGNHAPTPLGLKRIVEAMYNSVELNNSAIATDEYFARRTILAPTNVAVHQVNEAVAERVQGASQTYLSTDSIDADGGESAFFETEVLNSINLNGFPPHKLIFKKGIPVMMLRNLNPNAGLCNGTRLRIVDLKPHVIRAIIMTGSHNGREVLIPRIIFISNDDVKDFPFRLRRKQFPVVPAFAMTINKAQGQTVHNMGLYLPTPCFSHGQLYVALSRVTSRSKVKVLIEDPARDEEDGIYTKNIVYRQIFE